MNDYYKSHSFFLLFFFKKNNNILILHNVNEWKERFIWQKKKTNIKNI